MCILSIIFCTACNGKKSEEISKPEVENSAEVGLPNPFEEVEKLEDAENLANFKLKINDKISRLWQNFNRSYKRWVDTSFIWKFKKMKFILENLI